MELCLGTAQFGMDYGIAGQKKPELEYAVKCLDYATQNGVYAIDTAAAYGTAEDVLGSFLARKTIVRDKLFISTKLLPNILDSVTEKEIRKIIRNNVINSLRKLHTDYIDAYLLHSARYAYRPDIIAALHEIQEDGLAKMVGVSVYEPEEAKVCMENSNVGMIQIPYSIFDQRMKENGIFRLENRNNCKIHVRSVFIQGLITLFEEQVPPFLKKAKPILRKIDEICNETGISRVELAMAYVKQEKAVSHLVFGIDSLGQLKEDILLFQKNIPEDLLSDIETEFKGIDVDIVMPSLWKK